MVKASFVSSLGFAFWNQKLTSLLFLIIIHLLLFCKSKNLDFGSQKEKKVANVFVLQKQAKTQNSTTSQTTLQNSRPSTTNRANLQHSSSSRAKDNTKCKQVKMPKAASQKQQKQSKQPSNCQTLQTCGQATKHTKQRAK